MQFSSIQALVGWAFQIETVSGAKVQKFAESQAPAFGEMTFHDQKTQAAYVMLKINRLPAEERAVLWALHVGRDTEMMFLAANTPHKFGLKTDLELIRKWATGEGASYAAIGRTVGCADNTISRYERNHIIPRLERLSLLAYATLEIQHRSLLLSVENERELTLA
ncbi:helix-turn-helix transcriptional regulator [Chitinibacter bivalviorum]|uniref:Helix-turn-helix transcriptional regulator n=1 Tax=Chitinibacter bivalviorum TaxID=2739434 RepID=A0A7H9BHB9_9NEIS|nr:helix-turn-helix transcriptional regulator [Chitinibacter bivalviorum]QLG87656.1 helix-turn-helix transcriptional regulator [Chitinibacter bivalviorum]